MSAPYTPSSFPYWPNTYTTSANGSKVPTGTIIQYAVSTPPSGYLNCDGSAISRTTYSELFGILGTTYGAGNAGAHNVFSWVINGGIVYINFNSPSNTYISTGNSFIFYDGVSSTYTGLIATSATTLQVQAFISAPNNTGFGGTVQLTTPTTFNLPNAVGVTIRGAGTSWTIGSTGGSDTTVLAVANIPPHEHKTQMPGSVSVSSGGNGALGNQFNAGFYPTTADIYDNTGTLVTAAANPATSFSTRNAYLVLNYCIKY